MFKKILILLPLFLTLTIAGANYQIAAAVSCNSATLSAKEAIQCGAQGATGDTSTAAQAEGKLTTTLNNLINLFSVIIGFVAVFMIIFAGFRYITSGGNDTAVASAKNTILYAVVGLIIVALAQFIVKAVLRSL
jgi:heme/copper-type cytochrome/quinol oxidase subunit 2